MTPPVAPAANDDIPDTDLFRQLQDLDHDDPGRERVYEVLVRRYQWLVRWAARRYAGRGELPEELMQVGYLGLVEAIGRFDPCRGIDFVSFARPTVLGEIRRHFRDGRRWIRLPRKIQELKLQIREATDELTQTTGQAPTPADLAAHLEVTEDEVAEALGADDAFNPLSLDAPLGQDAAGATEATTYLDVMGDEDGDLAGVDASESLWPLLEQLPPREQEMLLLRFYGNKTQRDIGDRLGISQMHVSRLLQQTLESLRCQLTR